jgi:hypothetical protein
MLNFNDPGHDDAFFERLVAQHDSGKAGGKRKKRGTKLPAELAKAFSSIPGCEFVRSWDDGIPESARPADVQVALPPDGLSVLVECKETRVDRVAFDRIDDFKHRGAEKGNRQRRTLMLHAMSGGLSLIAVQRVWCNRSTTWLLSWQHWEALRRELKRESIPLTDQARPTSLHEVGLLRSSDFFSHVMEVRAESLRLPIVDYRLEGDD